MTRSLPSANPPAVERLASSLATHGAEEARILIVLGSGLNAVDRVTAAREVAYDAIDGMPRSAVPGHAGALLFGELGGVSVAIQRGRVHLYEGRPAHEVALAVHAFAAIGCRGFLLTNAAGGLHADWRPGALMRITDHINLQGASPLARGVRGLAAPYDRAWGETIDRCARECRVALHRGVYAGLPGPSYETPAEVRMLQWMGADAVGMSTVCEAVAAHAAGGKVAAISCITNPAAGLSDAALSHEEVLAESGKASAALSLLFEAAIPELARSLG